MTVKLSVSLIMSVILCAAGYAQTPRIGTKYSVVNGLAIDLPKPDYPQQAKDFCASGTVSVEVEIDDRGDVVSAEATVGDELLRASAVEAAKKAKFRVTKYGGKPVKVKGVVVYNFAPEGKCLTVGIVNKRALTIPKPLVNVVPMKEFTVTVQIVIDESGKVIYARALSGHPLYRAACERSARETKFSPTMIDPGPIKVKARLVYKFKPDGTIEF